MSDSLHSMDCSPPGFSVHGIFQARLLERLAISYSRGSSPHSERNCISCIAYIGRWIFPIVPRGSPPTTLNLSQKAWSKFSPKPRIWTMSVSFPFSSPFLFFPLHFSLSLSWNINYKRFAKRTNNVKKKKKRKNLCCSSQRLESKHVIEIH